RWVYVDPVNGKVDDVSDIAKHTCNPLLYVFAFDNKNYVSDVTKKYNQKWTEREFRVNRVNEQWLQETLNAFKSPFTEISDEDLQMKQIVSKQPLPSTLAAFKNHPLYVLDKHLLKYEVIYPEDAPRITSFRGSSVYSREYVQTVHSDIYWRRQGRVIRSGEVAYKVSKARPKWNKISQKMVRDLPLELFGYWQTEPFVPPVAKDGKVPRNEFGNVELFQANMLPKGTVHLPIPGLLRIANKLGIDCVPAVVGFDVHARGGGTHPVYDGFVVCEEFKEVLLAAYDEEEENSRKRLQEKKTIRALKNWRRLVKSAMIRDKVRKKYLSEV
ncbi:DNA repair protein complementing XP-C cells-like protein, partial [Leptotrombidium deliense]